MKSVNYDKPRITSTVILGVFLLISLIVTIICLPITWAMVNEALKANQENAGDTSGVIVVAGVMALALGLGMILVMVLMIGVFIVSSICLPFSILNRHSTLKPVRIISFVFDGLFGALMLTSLIKLILCLVGI